jgi:hypothetical protein
MKYKVRIEGGFMGFPRDYEGEVQLEEEKAMELFSVMERSAKSERAGWPDAMHYTIELQHGSKTRKAAFSESGLPGSIREFLHLISESKG